MKNMANTVEAQKVIQEAFVPIKEEYLQKEKQFEEVLNVVQDAVVKLGNSAQTKEQIGSANAEMLGDIAQKMNDRLEGVADQSQRAEILTKGIKKMQQVVEDAKEQAGKGEFGKVMNVLKSALKVVVTLGLDKTAKLEFAAAKFAMYNKDVEKIKVYSKEQVSMLNSSAKLVNKVQKARGR